MNYKEAAEILIKDVQGVNSEENINGVAHALASWVDFRDLEWEKWLMKDTNEILAVNTVVCSCGRPMKIERERHVVYTGNVT